MILNRSALLLTAQKIGPPLFLGLLLLYGLWPWLPLPHRPAQPRTIVFYGFSIVADVMTKTVFPAFQKDWLAQTGQSVEFVSSFGGSGTIRNQLVMGVPADLALLSLELDAEQLAEARTIPPGSWRRLPEHGVLNRTPFVLLVRAGNPLQLHDFSDLTRPGIKIVHPDPLTSGGANWAIVAEYGAGQRGHGGSAQAGRELLLGIWKNVVAQAGSARAARAQFENGFGDVLVTDEQELLDDQRQGKLKGEIVYPKSSILSEHTLVLVPDNIQPAERDLINAFVQFLWSDSAQRMFVEHGFRSVSPALNAANPRFGLIPDLFTIEDFGGWKRAKTEIVDGIWKEHVLKELRK